MRHAIFAVLFALVLTSCEPPTVAPTPTPTRTAAPSSWGTAAPSATATQARGRVIVILRADSDDVVPPANGTTTVCDFRIRGTIFDYRSGIAYQIVPVANDRQAYYGQTSTDESGTWGSPVISLSDGEWVLTVRGALTHPDQSLPIRVRCPTARPVTPLPVVTLPPVSAAGSPTTLDVFALGRLSGQIAWVARLPNPWVGPATQGMRRTVVVELWAVPLDRGAPRLAVRYRSAYAGQSGPSFADINVLRRQFSPDGRRIVLSVATGAAADGHALVVIDLESGRTLSVIGGTKENEITPAWSPDGALIAFERTAPIGYFGEIWTVAPDGQHATRVRLGTEGTTSPVFGWTPDSTRIGFAPINFERTTYALIDLRGNVGGNDPERCLRSSDAVDWRARVPSFAAGIGDCGPQPTRSQIVIADDASQRQRIVADVVVDPSDNTVTGVRDPRWDPSGRERLVYVEDGVQRSFVIHDVSLSTAARKQVTSRVSKAEWLPDGSGIVTIEEHPSTAPLEVNVWNVDGTLRTEGLFTPRAGDQDRLTDLAPRSY